jgi:hypothetical protein
MKGNEGARSGGTREYFVRSNGQSQTRTWLALCLTRNYKLPTCGFKVKQFIKVVS